MRAVVVLLVGICVWLLADRHKLSRNVEQLEKDKARLEKKLSAAIAAASGERKTWLQERIESGASSLEVAPRRTYNPNYPYPGTRPTTPNSRIIR